jgi:hypothetical protein
MDSIGEGEVPRCAITSEGPAILTYVIAAFDYHFGALQNTDNEFMHAYFGLMCVFQIHDSS